MLSAVDWGSVAYFFFFFNALALLSGIGSHFCFLVHLLS